MELVRRYSDVLIIVLIIINTGLHGTPVRESLINADLDGVELIKMGNVLEKPLLTLLGETLVKLEQNIAGQTNEQQKLKTELCKLETCTEWTKWSKCSARKVRTFGASSRTRTCGVKPSVCPSNVAETVETESKICQGTECRYTITKNNFCIKLNDTVKISWKSAQEECHTLGGHLLNIDSELKAADIDEILDKYSSVTDVWIDGTRSLPDGEWKYEYGSKDSSFSMWEKAEPDSADDCKVYDLNSGKREWWGRPCTDGYYFLCEIL